MKEILRNFYHEHYRFKKYKILGRTACLSSEIIAQLGFQKNMINHQKSRVDYLMEISLNPKTKANSKEVIPFLERSYISGTIKQQEKDFFDYPKPNLIVMDSFSELTDQLFINKINGTKFLANYSDIKHDENFKLLYDCVGLMDVAQIENFYSQFFKKITTVYGDVPILFFHFPTKLDQRLDFQHRGDNILTTINFLASLYQNLHSISVSDIVVNKSNEAGNELKDFPYHYSKETYAAFVKQTNSILANIEKKKSRA